MKGETDGKNPKERVVFDADVYDEDFLREYLSDDYEMYKDELEVDFDTYVEEEFRPTL